MSVAFIGWLLFLIFFGRVDPIIKSTTEGQVNIDSCSIEILCLCLCSNFKLYHYWLVTMPFWFYSFFAPFLYPIIALYIANGNRVVGVFVSFIEGSIIPNCITFFLDYNYKY